MGFLTAFFVVLFTMPSLIKVARMKHLVDEPTEGRKLHSRSVPTIGGIIIFAAIIFSYSPVSYTHLRAHETVLDLVCRLLLEKKTQQKKKNTKKTKKKIKKKNHQNH